MKLSATDAADHTRTVAEVLLKGGWGGKSKKWACMVGDDSGVVMEGSSSPSPSKPTQNRTGIQLFSHHHQQQVVVVVVVVVVLYYY